MRSAQSSEGSDRVTTYAEFKARQAKRAEAIEVQEQTFDTWDELHAHVKQVKGELA
jgi:hypothetical protein